MKQTSILAVMLAILSVATSAFGEYRVYKHAGCTKDGFKVTEELVWNCKGACKTTPLKSQIMREARDSRATYPKIVAKYSKAQITTWSHLKEIKSRVKIKSDLTANKGKFGGRC